MASLLMPLLGSVAAKAGDALVGELLRAWGLDAAHQKLERHLAALGHPAGRRGQEPHLLEAQDHLA